MLVKCFAAIIVTTKSDSLIYQSRIIPSWEVKWIWQDFVLQHPYRHLETEGSFVGRVRLK